MPSHTTQDIQDITDALIFFEWGLLLFSKKTKNKFSPQKNRMITESLDATNQVLDRLTGTLHKRNRTRADQRMFAEAIQEDLDDLDQLLALFETECRASYGPLSVQKAYQQLQVTYIPLQAYCRTSILSEATLTELDFHRAWKTTVADLKKQHKQLGTALKQFADIVHDTGNATILSSLIKTLIEYYDNELTDALKLFCQGRDRSQATEKAFTIFNNFFELVTARYRNYISDWPKSVQKKYNQLVHRHEMIRSYWYYNNTLPDNYQAIPGTTGHQLAYS